MGSDTAKNAAACAAARLVQSGMVVGLGTGTTARFFIEALATRLQTGELSNVCGVPTSQASEKMAQTGGLPIVPLSANTRPDLTVDGADEVDPALNLIKGGGGALVREKLVALASREMVVIADASKQKTVLGAFPLPVAVVPFGWDITLARLVAALHTDAACLTLRGGSEHPFTTDDGLFIVDCALQTIPDPAETERIIKTVAGVVEVGLFVGIASRVLYGHDNGTVTHQARP